MKDSEKDAGLFSVVVDVVLGASASRAQLECTESPPLAVLSISQSETVIPHAMVYTRRDEYGTRKEGGTLLLWRHHQEE